jgi:hypothetical protein
MKKFAPQRRKERKEEEETKEEKTILLRKQHSFSCFCLSLRPSRLRGANFLDPTTLS